ncbi:MAG: ABC transporter permease [Bacteroides sp.]|nr:ABC transporter permease [Bacteroidales bacterium]MBD5295092.1 ABC transporter permease [Bacteroides sp.]MDE6234549.1 ABC transporter permease [Muribaculaceae bacterium]
MKRFFKEYYSEFLREFNLVRRNQGILVFLLLLPLAYPLIYSLIYNPEVVRDVPIVVVDHDRTPKSRELVRRLDATQGIKSIGYALDLSEARKAMNEHKVYGILEIPEGFDRNIGRMEEGNAVMYCEMSLLLRYKAILVGCTDVMLDMGADITTERIESVAPLAETIATGDLLGISNVNMGNIEGGFDSFIMPGVLILILQQALMLAVGICGGTLRERPELGGSIIQGSILTSMIARMSVFLIFMIVPTIYVIHYVPLIFRFPMAGNVFHELMFITPMLIATIFWGFILQGIVRERESVFLIWVVTSIIFLFLSGLTWPRYAMSAPWLFLSDCVPATWGLEGFIRMNTNGASIAQAGHDYIHLWILTGIYGVLAYCVQRWVQRPAIRYGLKHNNGIV